MTDVERLMREWLVSGTDAQMRHAASRIAIGFEGGGYEFVDVKPSKPCGSCGKAVGDLLRAAMRK